MSDVVQLEAITLEGRHVRLEPLQAHHADALLQAALDPRIWEFTSTQIQTATDMQQYVETALGWRRAGTAVPFATVETGSDTVIGSTRFENIDVANRRVEIGWSWLNPRWWRTPINTEAKYLMLRHAFDAVYFSIVDDEWPAVKDRLEKRLDPLP